MAITEELELDVSPALSALEGIDSAFSQMIASFSDSLSSAVESFRADPIADEITTAGQESSQALASSLEEAAGAFDASPIEASLSTAGTEGGEALASSLTDSVDAFDAGPIAEEIAGIDATVPVEADTSEVGPAISDAVASVEAPPVEVEVDASDGLEALRELQEEIGGLRGEADELATSIGGIGEGAGGATQGVAALGKETSTYGTIASTATISTGVFTKSGEGLGKTLTGVAQKAGPVGITIAGVATSIGALGLGASRTADINKRFEATFGDLGDEIEQVSLGGLNEDLATLSIQTGNSDDDLRQMAVTLGNLGLQSGRGRESVAGTVEQVIALSIALSTANPALGDAVAVADRLPTALAKGGRAVAALGLNINAAEIETRALADTQKATVEELTQYDKAAAGAALASEQLGNTLGTKVAEGAKSAEIRLRSAKTAIGEMFEELGAPLAEPIVNIVEVATTALTSLFGLLEDTHVLDLFGKVVETVADGLLLAVDAVNVLRPGLAGLFAILPGGQSPLEAFDASVKSIVEETGKAPGTLAAAKLGIFGLGEEAKLMSDNLEGATGSASEYTLSIDDVAFATKEAAEAHDEMITSIAEGFPDASDAISRFSKDSEISFKEFQKDLTDTAAANESFVKNLQTIIDKGGLQIAASLAQLGPEVASRAASEIAKQTPTTIKALEEQEGVIRRRLVELAIQTARIQSEAKAAAILIDGGIPKEAALTVVEQAHGAVLAKIGELTPKEAATYISTQAGGIVAGTLTVTNAATGVIGTASAAAAQEGLLGGGRAGGSWVFGVDDTLGRSSGTIASAARGAAGVLNDGAGTAYSAGRNVAANFVSGLSHIASRSVLGGIWGGGYAAGRALGAGANAGIGAASRSKVAMGIAQNFVDSLRFGLRDGTSQVRAEASNLGRSIGDATSVQVSDFPAFRLPALATAALGSSSVFGSGVNLAAGAVQVNLSFPPGADRNMVHEAVELAHSKFMGVLQTTIAKGRARPS